METLLIAMENKVFSQQTLRRLNDSFIHFFFIKYLTKSKKLCHILGTQVSFKNFSKI